MAREKGTKQVNIRLTLDESEQLQKIHASMPAGAVMTESAVVKHVYLVGASRLSLTHTHTHTQTQT